MEHMQKQKYAGFRYIVETFGCQMNARDSEQVAGILEDNGFKRANTRDEADCLLFNTCCVREHAEKRVFGNIGALQNWKDEVPGRILGVFGCMMQQMTVAEKLFRRFPFVNLVFGTSQLESLPLFLDKIAGGERVFAVGCVNSRIEENLPSIRVAGSSAFVNITYGCNNYCSYCIVPYVRGPERSRAPEAIEKEVRSLTSDGYSEITLLGQNVNSYGSHGGTDFLALLERLSNISGLRRLRFMTSHPKDMDNRLIDSLFTLSPVCHHVHLPLQSGSDRILSAMNRGYTRAQYTDIVKRLRQTADDVEITTDIIVGFPTETEDDFLDTLGMVECTGFSNAFTFKYSLRTGTKAAAMHGQIDEDVKRDRLNRLNALQSELAKRRNHRYHGYKGEVLVDGAEERSAGLPMVYGKFTNNTMVYFPGSASLIGRYVQVRVTGTQKNSLLGERMEESLC